MNGTIFVGCALRLNRGRHEAADSPSRSEPTASAGSASGH